MRKLIENAYPAFGALTLATCLASCGDSTSEAGNETGTTTGTTSTETTNQTTASTVTMTTSADSTSSEGGSTETTTGGPYPLAPGDDAAKSTDLLDIQAREGTTTTIGFVWDETAGWPAASDMAVHVTGHERPLFQVFTQGGKPFARAGLEVVPLDASAEYQITVALGPHRLTEVKLWRDGEAVLTHAYRLPREHRIEGLELVMPSADMLAAPVAVGEITVE